MRQTNNRMVFLISKPLHILYHPQTCNEFSSSQLLIIFTSVLYYYVRAIKYFYLSFYSRKVVFVLLNKHFYKLMNKLW